MPVDIERIWNELERDYSGAGDGIYRRLDLASEGGLRLAILSPGRTRAILIEVEPSSVEVLAAPRWKGMGVRTVALGGPLAEASHICLYIENPEHRTVFTALCTDIILTLDNSILQSRTSELQVCFDRWSMFFERCGDDGLSAEHQRGLFGELCLLKGILQRGLPMGEAVDSWKGCKGNDHDFVIADRAIEVKTTLSKEPRKVIVNSERQLDDTGLECLFLFVLTLNQEGGSGRTLPEVVAEVKDILSRDANSTFTFKAGLIASGYLDSDEDKYTTRYAIRTAETYRVHDCFPRITTVPPGVGDLQYSLTLSACCQYKTKRDDMLIKFTGMVVGYEQI